MKKLHVPNSSTEIASLFEISGRPAAVGPVTISVSVVTASVATEHVSCLVELHNIKTKAYLSCVSYYSLWFRCRSPMSVAGKG